MSNLWKCENCKVCKKHEKIHLNAFFNRFNDRVSGWSVVRPLDSSRNSSKTWWKCSKSGVRSQSQKWPFTRRNTRNNLKCIFTAFQAQQIMVWGINTLNISQNVLKNYAFLLCLGHEQCYVNETADNSKATENGDPIHTVPNLVTVLVDLQNGKRNFQIGKRKWAPKRTPNGNGKTEPKRN